MAVRARGGSRCEEGGAATRGRGGRNRGWGPLLVGVGTTARGRRWSAARPRHFLMIMLGLLGGYVPLLLRLHDGAADAWQFTSPPRSPPFSTTSKLSRSDVGVGAAASRTTRRDWFKSTAASILVTTGASSSWLGIAACPDPALALVKGVAPPPSKKVGDQRPKCKNLDECQALAEQREREQQQQQQQMQQSIDDEPSQGLDEGPIQTTKGGVRYRDLVTVPSGDNADAAVVKVGDEVQLAYKVLKLGKRSYDGLSGEGTVVFSRGYGLEDDETKPGDKLYRTVVGAYSNIVALNEALVGMRVGGTRRFSILPQLGWRRPTRACDGGPGGSGTGGDVKTDFVVVPTAQLVAEEACFDQTKQPFPTSYAQQRRMAQRFDQSLIMEVQVVSAQPSNDGLL